MPSLSSSMTTTRRLPTTSTISDSRWSRTPPLTPQKRWVRVSPDPDGGTSLLLAVATTDAQRAAIGNQTGGRVGLFLHTDDFRSRHAHLVARGVRMTEEPRIEPYGTVVVFEDRYGNLWDLIEPISDDQAR